MTEDNTEKSESGVNQIETRIGKATDGEDENSLTPEERDRQALKKVPQTVREKDPSEITEADLEYLDADEQETVKSFLPQFDTDSDTEPDDDSDDDVEINVDAVVESITGHPDRKPTTKEVKVAYANEDITDAEMDAAMGVAVTTVSSSTPDSDESSKTVSDTVDEDEDDTPEPATLEETGLLDDEDQFPWEGDGDEIASTSKLGEQQTYRRTYKGVPFEFHEPRDKQQYENRLGILEGLQDNPTDRQQKQAEKFAERIAHDNITVNEHDLDDVYQVESSDEGKKVVAQSDYPDHDLEEINRATPVWEAMNWYDQMLVGQEMEQLIIGQGKFRSGVR